MPLDFGARADSDMVAKEAVASGVHGGVNLGLQSLLDAGAHVGQALKALREQKKLSLADIAQTTCVRRAYLQALEELNIDQLPSRPFAIGYVKAYAEAVGASGELAVRQFRKDAPSPDEALKAPVGVHKERDPRLSWLAGVCAVVATAVVIWNLAQHAVAHDGAPTPPVAVTNAPRRRPWAAKAPVALAAAQPAPADSDVPQPYVTPGMAKAVGGRRRRRRRAGRAGQGVHELRAPPSTAPPADKSVVTLQAPCKVGLPGDPGLRRRHLLRPPAGAGRSLPRPGQCGGPGWSTCVRTPGLRRDRRRPVARAAAGGDQTPLGKLPSLVNARRLTIFARLTGL